MDRWKVVFGSLVALLTLIVAILTLWPEDERRQWLCNLNLSNSCSTATEAIGLIGSPGTTLATFPRSVQLFDARWDDFDIQAIVHVAPSANFQGAGLYIEQEDGRRISLSIAYCDIPEATHCVGRGIYLELLVGDTFDSGSYVSSIPFTEDVAILRLRVRDQKVSGWFSGDAGSTWQRFQTVDWPYRAARIGIVARNSNNVDDFNPFDAPSVQARFDYLDVYPASTWIVDATPVPDLNA
jgi:hypothetical protein